MLCYHFTDMLIFQPVSIPTLPILHVTFTQHYFCTESYFCTVSVLHRYQFPRIITLKLHFAQTVLFAWHQFFTGAIFCASRNFCTADSFEKFDNIIV